MRLSAKMLQNVENVNNWKFSNQAFLYEGQENEIYLQLIDIGKDPAVNPKDTPLPEFPLRYIPQGSSVSLSITFPSIDTEEEFSVSGTQPFADDKSIWKFTLTSDQLPNSGYAKITLTEDGKSRTVNLRNVIYTELLDIGGC